MKNKKITILLIVINIILVGVVCSLINKNGNIIKEKQIIKEMTETEYNNSITALNKSHENYALQVQENKIKVASAITDMGVETSESATADTMASNIKNIVGNTTAEKVSYNNTNSGLTSTNLQGAVDELNNNLTNLFSDYYESEEVNTTTKGYNSLCEITIPAGTYLVGHFGYGCTTNPMETAPYFFINDIGVGHLSCTIPITLENQSKLSLQSPTSLETVWREFKLYALRIK